MKFALPALLTALTVFFSSISAFATDACPAVVASCTVTGDVAVCFEAVGTQTGQPLGNFQTACASGGGTFASTPCATANRVGSCSIQASAETGAMVLRLYAPVPVAYLPTICAQNNGTVCN